MPESTGVVCFFYDDKVGIRGAPRYKRIIPAHLLPREDESISITEIDGKTVSVAGVVIHRVNVIGGSSDVGYLGDCIVFTVDCVRPLRPN